MFKDIAEHLTPQPNADTVTPDITTVKDTPDATLKPLTEDRLHALLQMQRTDPFCKHISKHLSNGKVPKHEAHLFLQVEGLLYKHVMDTNQKFLALVILKASKQNVKLPLQLTSIFSPSLIISQDGQKPSPYQTSQQTLVVSTFINHYFPLYMCPRCILSDNGTDGSSSPTTQH